MSNGFGWSYPAGCSDNDIDASVGADEETEEYSFIPIFSPIFTVNALPSILWYNLEMAHVHMKMFKREQVYYTAKIEHICDILMQQNYNA